MKWILLTTDMAYFSIFMIFGLFCFSVRHNAHWRQVGRYIVSRPTGMTTMMLLVVFFMIGALDSIHLISTTPLTGSGAHINLSDQAGNFTSVFDQLISPIGKHDEKTYSAPMALTLYVKDSFINADKTVSRYYPPLQYAAHGINTMEERNADVIKRLCYGVGYGLLSAMVFFLCITSIAAFNQGRSFFSQCQYFFNEQKKFAWRTFFIVAMLIVMSAFVLKMLGTQYHLLGTDKVGKDVFYLTLKSIRTGLIIGTLSTMIMTPFAMVLGLLAGYFGGYVDDVIQYLYTTLSSIPGVLLIAASVLSLQVYIGNHAEQFSYYAQRDDLRLFALCAILGVTSWTSLCRLLRGETLKLRDLDFVQAARALGCSRYVILKKHVLPNVLHVVLICIALDFSGLVLAEAVLSYVGVGVSASTISWGNMINSARLELARDPIVWWPIFAAFSFMFALVLSANILADILRDALDPRR